MSNRTKVASFVAAFSSLALPVVAEARPRSTADPIVQHVVPLPASVTEVEFPGYTEDGSRLLAAAASTQWDGTHIVSFTEQGSKLRCLTCRVWHGAALTKPFAFEDGRRVLVRVGDQTAVSPADHGIVECTPSVLDCNKAKVVPIIAPSGGDPNVEQDQREFRIAPDGVHVALSQIRSTATGLSTGVGIVGRLVRQPGSYRVADARVVATGGELKGFTPDGKSVTYARFLGAFEAGNPDDVRIRLRRGTETRLTHALDWDEDVDLGPRRWRGRNWMVVGSARGKGLLETVSQVRRPTAIEAGLSALPFAVFLNRSADIAEPWLVDLAAARAGDLGRPLAPGAVAAGWDSKAVTRWKPDGTAIVFWQKRIGGTATRVVLDRLPARRPKHVHADRTPTPTWAPALAGFVPRDPPLPQARPGRVSGSMTVVTGLSPLVGYQRFIQITYASFADRRGFVINGVERSYYDAPALYGGRSLYSASLSVSGKHTGYLKATNVPISTAAIGGRIESEVDGRHLALGPLP
jgi:hypothetical protein